MCTLPKGPCELGEDYFAGNRLGVSLMGIKVWGDKLEPRYYLLYGRVIEKSSQYLIACFGYVRNELAREGWAFRHLVAWTDGPAMMKSREVFGTMAYGSMIENPDLQSYHPNFTAPKHGKFDLDGLFGQSNCIIDTAAKKVELAKVADVVASVSKYYERRHAADPEFAKRIVSEFLPPPKSAMKFYKFKAENLLGIKHSFAWSFTRNDARRRKELNGREDKTLATGIDVRNHHFSHVPVEASFKGFPRLDEELAPAAALPGMPPVASVAPPLLHVDIDLGDIEDEPDTLQELAITTSMWEGLRLSYAKAPEPETKRKMRRAHLNRFAKNCTPRPHALRIEARPYKTIAEKKTSAVKKATIKQRQRAAINAYDRRQRVLPQ